MRPFLSDAPYALGAMLTTKRRILWLKQKLTKQESS
jgi:hypothetical protein